MINKLLTQIKNDNFLFKALIAAFLSRIFIFTVAVLSNNLITERVGEGIWRASIPFFNLFAVWDSAYYVHIAVHGYSDIFFWAFFPLYSILIKLSSFLFFFSTEPFLVGGFFISNISFFLLVLYFYKLTNLIFKNKKLAYYSVIFLSIFPASLFFSAVYTESLLLLLMVASLYYTEKCEWKKSTIFGFLAGFTKQIGFLIFLPLLYKIINKIKKGETKLLLIYPVAILFSYIIFMLCAYFATGNLFAHYHVNFEYWNIVLFNPITSFFNIEKINQMIIIPIILLSFLSLFHFLKFKKILPYVLHAFVLLMIYLFSGPLISFPRFSLTLIPIFWYMSKISIENKTIKIMLYIFCLFTLLIGTSMFVNWYSFY